MKNLEKKFDYVIIGSGLGGLASGLILAREGKSVCILEKNAQIGGTLQTFVRSRTKYDTGVHYLGGLEPKQPLYPYFKYLGLMDDLNLEKMDEDGFDIINFFDDPNAYPIAQGYDNFKKQLLKYFPKEEPGLDKYIEKIKKACSSFSMYYLKDKGNFSEEVDLFFESAKEVIDDCTSNIKLRAILASSNFLYAGVGDKSPFYMHALIINSYIESSYRVIGGGSTISKSLEKQIKKLGGEIVRNAEVVKVSLDNLEAKNVILKDGTIIEGKTFISNIHPTQTFKLFETKIFRKTFLKRMENLENTESSFVLYLKLKPGTYPYKKKNIYFVSEKEIWNLPSIKGDSWGKNLSIFSAPSRKNPEFTSSLIVIVYMNFNEVKPWESSFNTITEGSEREQSYQDFKDEKSKIVIKNLIGYLPELEGKIEEYSSSTPLTQRDYINSPGGSLYGVMKDFHTPMKSYINTNTKIKNLFLTGQNTGVHGILGVVISAAVTCSEFLGRDYLVNKIRESCGDDYKKED